MSLAWMWIGYPFFPSKAIFLVIYLNFKPRKLYNIQYFSGNAIGFLQIQTPSLNPMHWNFFNNTKSMPKFHYIYFI
jgi:hypothetical protein